MDNGSPKIDDVPVNFSGISNEWRLGRLLRLPLRLIPSETRVPILQGRLRGKKWIVGSHTHGCWLGSYEYEKQLFFQEKVTPGSIVFDVGANVGFYTLLASVLVGDTGRVFAFEPVSRNLLYLKEHLRLNRVTNVTIIEVAVSDRCGVASFVEGPMTATGHLSGEGQLRVQTASLDELVSGGCIPVPDFIKIDVEGAEMLVLSGAKSVLETARPAIFLATHGDEVHRLCCGLLRSSGYVLGTIGGERMGRADELFASCEP